MVKITKGLWGCDATKTGSLCGRLNNACSDGMNVTDKRSKVTCAFCLKLLGVRRG
jgi:hypothetical protein